MALNMKDDLFQFLNILMNPYLCNTKNKIMQAIIKTNKGEMKVSLYTEDAPNTVANFVKLAKEGYYNGLKWHRVLPNFVIQGGCPNSRDGAKGMPGTGGPGYQINCETRGDNQYHDRGVLSMAHAGRNTGGSQFFVCHSRDNTSHLDRQHTCFGKVTEGVDTVDDIREGDSIDSIEIID
jgi:peptidyl-prolyl cis-trans isomerase B (cyclophilin B)